MCNMTDQERDKVMGLTPGKHVTLKYPSAIIGKTIGDDVGEEVCKWCDELFKYDLVPANLGIHAIFRKI